MVHRGSARRGNFRNFSNTLGDVVGDLVLLPGDLRDVLLDALQEVCDAFITGLVVERWPDVDVTDQLDDIDTAFVVEVLDELLGGFQEDVVGSALRKLEARVGGAS